MHNEYSNFLTAVKSQKDYVPGDAHEASGSSVWHCVTIFFALGLLVQNTSL